MSGSAEFDLYDNAAIDEELFKPQEKTKQEKDEDKDGQPSEDDQAKIVLPQPTNTHMAITNNFQLDSRQEINQHKKQVQIHSRLKAKHGVFAKTVFGRIIDHTDTAQVLQAARDFYTMLERGLYKEARTQFRLMTSDLQEAITYSLLRESGLDLKPLRADLLGLLKDAQLSTELKELAGAELSHVKENPLTGFLAGMKSSADVLTGYLDELPLGGKPEFVRLERALYKTIEQSVIAEYGILREHLLYTHGNVKENRSMLLAGQMGLREFAEYLDNTIIGLENVCFSFTEKLPEGQTVFKDAVLAAQAQINKYIADTMRQIYQDTPDNIIFKLSADAYFLLNDALIRLNETQLSVLFCDLDSVPIGQPDELAFLDECYEYISQCKSGTAVALNVIGQIFRLPAAELSGWEHGKLDELHKLSEFLGQARAALREFAKKLEDIKKIKKLENVLVVLNTFFRGLSELEKILTAKVSINKSGALKSSLTKYRLLQESDKWQNAVAVISDFSQNNI
ncbi:hypothetical protein RDn1_191 [Candidatus Termititenax dinenymphae]|uniref:Uncharacterized protein n=1 Tax=Candidatus Termititenax dinenymphae TaxID=2218523 RepID=A0A388TKF5_9BACT|nr:hypothetical protein RDn1_191 [Candidatus Termititenax dinenymphae]